MKIVEGTHAGRPVLALIPESRGEKELLVKYLGDQSPLVMRKVWIEANSPDENGHVYLWGMIRDLEEMPVDRVLSRTSGEQEETPA